MERQRNFKGIGISQLNTRRAKVPTSHTAQGTRAVKEILPLKIRKMISSTVSPAI
jgi:hypothetical protein